MSRVVGRHIRRLFVEEQRLRHKAPPPKGCHSSAVRHLPGGTEKQITLFFSLARLTILVAVCLFFPSALLLNVCASAHLPSRLSVARRQLKEAVPRAEARRQCETAEMKNKSEGSRGKKVAKA